jgi:hypothetical protein
MRDAFMIAVTLCLIAPTAARAATSADVDKFAQTMAMVTASEECELGSYDDVTTVMDDFETKIKTSLTHAQYARYDSLQGDLYVQFYKKYRAMPAAGKAAFCRQGRASLEFMKKYR